MIDFLPLRLPVAHQGTQVPQSTQPTPVMPQAETPPKKQRGRARKKSRNG